MHLRTSSYPVDGEALTARVFGEKQYQLLALAQWLALAVAAGQFLSSAGAADFNENDLYFAIVHNTGLIHELLHGQELRLGEFMGIRNRWAARLESSRNAVDAPANDVKISPDSAIR